MVALVAVAADMVHTAGALLASTARSRPSCTGPSPRPPAGWWPGWPPTGCSAGTDASLIYLLLGGVFLTLAGALPDLPALARSQLDSGFGPVVTRVAITVTLGLGAAMVAAGLAGSEHAAAAGTLPA